jgi:hypothetical protein
METHNLNEHDALDRLINACEWGLTYGYLYDIIIAYRKL